MRLIGSISPKNGDSSAYVFSYFLTGRGIRNTCEETVDKEGEPLCHIWVYEEDEVEEALALFEEYKKNPEDPRFRAAPPPPPRQEREEEEVPPPQRKRRPFLSPSPYGIISVLILITVIALFIWAQFGREGAIAPKIPGIIQAPALSPVAKDLIYEYPPYFQERDQLLKLYTVEDAQAKKAPSQEAIAVIEKLRASPPWMGIYERIVAHLIDSSAPIAYDGQLFVQIRQGEVWRLFTPALLHFDFLHIFFNVLWFILLSNQIEHRIRKLRYLILIVLIAVVSNTCQYLMSGPFFMGLSGVVCGMAAFIWARQQVAPWEGYLLHRFTLIFLSIFVVGMFALQIVFFFLQIFSGFEATVGIANTAHLSGALVGYLLGRMRNFFAIPKK